MKTVKEDREEIQLKVYAHNLEAFINNGLITVYDVTDPTEKAYSTSSINTDIVNQIRSGDNVTIYTQSEGEDNSELNRSEENESSLHSSEQEVVMVLIENNNNNRKKVIIVVTPTDHPLPLPSWHEVEKRPLTDDPIEWEKWRRNVLIQKAWTSKFPFLAEHYECIPVNQRVNAWRNRIEKGENVRDFTITDQDIFEQDPNIGEDIRNLYSSEDRKDIFYDDPYIGTDIERLFKDEEEK